LKHLTIRIVRTLAALLLVGCADDLKLDTDDGETEIVTTEPLAGGGFTTRVDASDSVAWVYFSRATGSRFSASGRLEGLIPGL
jgi:hypothetical protein